MNLITAHAGVEHITSANIAVENINTFGAGNYVFSGRGQELRAELQSKNLIRIYSGEGMMNGRHFEMVDSYEEVTINSGEQFKTRNDLICIRYRLDQLTGVEIAELVAIEGNSTSNSEAQDPEYNSELISNGAIIYDFPIYRVIISSVHTVTYQALFTPVGTVGDRLVQTELTLNQSLDDIENYKKSIDEDISDFKNLINNESTKFQNDVNSKVNELESEFNSSAESSKGYSEKSKEYSDKAKEYRDQAQAFTPEGYPVFVEDTKKAILELSSGLEETKKSVSDGKALVATAITDKGVATESTSTFEVMADNISKIETGGGELHGACISGSTAESFYIGQSIDLVFNDEIIKTATIDSDGTFSFLDIQQPGIYSVSITANDISTVNNITITSDHVINKTILNTVIIANYANVNVSTEETSLFNQTARLYLNDELINEFLISNNGTLNFKISKVGNYTLKSVGDDEAINTFTITEEDLINKNTILIDLSFLKIVTWADGTDKEIAAMLKAHYAGKLTLSDYWSVGDIRKVSLNSMDSIGVSESHEAQEVELVIIDFEHDDLASGGKAAITVQQRDCLINVGYMNSSETTENGWDGCARRTWCNNVYKKALPTTLANLIKTVAKKTSAGHKSSTIITSNDDVFLISEVEIFGRIIKSIAGEGTQYEYYETTANRVKYRGTSRANAAIWWERSPEDSTLPYFCGLTISGDSNRYRSNYTVSLAPAFCI